MTRVDLLVAPVDRCYHAIETNRGLPQVMIDVGPSSQRKRGAWAPCFLAAATIGATAAYLLRENADGDSWWQAAIGKTIIATGAVPHIDAFSKLGLGRPYHDSHWLFQVVTGAADRLAGMTGISLMAVLLWAIALFLCFSAVRQRASLPTAYLLLLAVVLGVNDRFIPRPDVVTCLMIAAFYLLLDKGIWQLKRGIALMTFLQILWANSHGLFIIGPFMVLCYWLEAMVRRTRDANPMRRNLSILLALVVAATVCTPFGLAGWRYASLLWTEATTSGPTFFASIQELAPTFGRTSLALPDFWVFVGFLAVWLMVAAYGLYGRKLSFPRFLITAGLCVVACIGRRNVPLFILAAAPFIAEHAPAVPRLPKIRSQASWVGVGLAIFAAWFPLSGKYFEMMRLPVRFGLGPSPSVFPKELPAFLARSCFRGQIFNSAYLGGFCLYHGYRPLIDTRWEVYGEQILRDFYRAAIEPSRWQSMVLSHDIRGVLLAHSSVESRYSLPRLAADRNWRLVWYDSSASFWARHDQLPAVPALIPDSGADLVRPTRMEESYQLAYFYQAIGAYRKALGCYQDALVRWGIRDDTLEEIGRIQVTMGLVREGEATFQRLLARNPVNSVALRSLSFLALMRGDTGSAESFARRALLANPADTEARAILDRLGK